MKQTLNYLIFIIVILISCKAQKEVKVNTKVNKKYSKSVKSFRGTLSRDEYTSLISNLEIELKTKLPEDKSILINYNQGASNCFLAGYKQQNFSDIINNVINISNRMSKEFGAVDFFIYSDQFTFSKSAYLNLRFFL